MTVSKWTIIALAAVTAIVLLVPLLVGELLTRPATQAIGPPPRDLGAVAIELPAGRTGRVAGWFVQGRPGAGVVLLLHGVRANRRQMLGRARFLKAAGYSTLLIDLPAHGESAGDRITFGARESHGVASALDYLRQRLPHEKIAVIGISLGAASLVLARERPPLSAVVLESMYPTVTDAVASRLAIRLGAAGEVLTPLLLWQLPVRLGVPVSALRPIDRVSTLGALLLIASGTADRHTPWPQTQQLFARAGAPKALWGLEDVAHVDLHRALPRAYEQRIVAFLAATLR